MATQCCTAHLVTRDTWPDPHLPLPVVVRLVIGPVGEGPEAGAVSPGEGALVKEVLQPHPAHLATCHDEDT